MKSIVRVLKRGYCIAIVRSNSVMRASGYMTLAECKQAIQGQSNDFLARQAEMYRHFISTKDIDKKAPRQRVYPS